MADIDVIVVDEQPAAEEPEAPEAAAPEEAIAEEAEAEREFSDVEKKAIDMGWRPEDEFSEEKPFISAEEYIGRKPLYDKIDELKKSHRSEMREFKKVVEGLSKQMRSAEKQGMEKVLSALNNKRLDAVEEGNVKAFVEADKEFNEKFQEYQAEPTASDVEQSYVEDAPELQEFISRNKEWFNFDTVEHSAMASDADQFYRNLVTFRQDLDTNDVLSMTEDYIKQKYKDQFENPLRKAPSKVDTSKPARATKRAKASEDQLTDFQKRIYKSIRKDNPEYTVEDYLQVVNDEVVVLE